ncbi:MAG: hypothetical protein KFF72_08920 [Arthrospira sp. SH-MAG29]|nr:hypothetical protein [Arthrospira sp. SH-MAG29]MBS0016466.1 hypothetical protein [Arthrospira sp. SH-MAG29]
MMILVGCVRTRLYESSPNNYRLTHLNQLSGVQDNYRSVVRRSVVRQKSIIGY